MVMMKPSAEEQAAKAQEEIAEIEAAQADSLTVGELAQLFKMGSEHTDIQRENKEKEITGKIVHWTLPVYDVKKSGKGYRIQTKSTTSAAGTFVTLIPRDDAERAQIEGLKEDNRLTVKGRITGTTMRNIDINPAVLMR